MRNTAHVQTLVAIGPDEFVFKKKRTTIFKQRFPTGTSKQLRRQIGLLKN
jgi:hypothetical protein